jgi:Ca-activated chloride channel family protein
MSTPTPFPTLPKRLAEAATALLLVSFFFTSTARADNRLVLQRTSAGQHDGQVRGVVDLVVDPQIEGAKVSVDVDGQRVAAGLLSPWRVMVDFGPLAVEHRITVTAFAPDGKRVRWSETVNHGNLPLKLDVEPVDAGQRVFLATATAPQEDPIVAVELWHEGRVVAKQTTAPYRFDVPENVLAAGFVQFTAKTQSGEEAAAFWSPAGSIVSEEMQVRTVPIFVSVVDRSGNTRDDVQRTQFRIIDNNTEGKIIEFGKAFDQPISIALLLDASASMSYSMEHASKAAMDFVQRALKEGDRCSVTAIRSVPRRVQALTADRSAIAQAVASIQPEGHTALNDAIVSAIRELDGEKNRRAIVVMTDGEDTSSNYGWDDVQGMARQAAIPIYFIAYEGAGEDGRSLDKMQYVAAETGGFVATATQQNLLARYEAIEKDLRAQFAILYQVTDFGKSNEYRRVRVVLDSPKLEARTIKGYFTP